MKKLKKREIKKTLEIKKKSLVKDIDNIQKNEKYGMNLIVELKALLQKSNFNIGTLYKNVSLYIDSTLYDKIAYKKDLYITIKQINNTEENYEQDIVDHIKKVELWLEESIKKHKNDNEIFESYKKCNTDIYKVMY